jgi:hypothetical protein
VVIPEQHGVALELDFPGYGMLCTVITKAYIDVEGAGQFVSGTIGRSIVDVGDLGPWSGQGDSNEQAQSKNGGLHFRGRGVLEREREENKTENYLQGGQRQFLLEKEKLKSWLDTYLEYVGYNRQFSNLSSLNEFTVLLRYEIILSYSPTEIDLVYMDTVSN